MAQNLLEISQEAFRLQLYRIPSKNLVKLLEEIYKFKWENGKDFNDETIMDIERKETKINAELMRRGYLKSKDYHDYFAWLAKINKKKRVF